MSRRKEGKLTFIAQKHYNLSDFTCQVLCVDMHRFNEQKNQESCVATLTLSGSEWAENKIITSLRISSGNFFNSSFIRSANVFASNGWVAHRSIMLHLIFLGKSLHS